jgi:hypothetical protein
MPASKTNPEGASGALPLGVKFQYVVHHFQDFFGLRNPLRSTPRGASQIRKIRAWKWWNNLLIIDS